MPKHDFEGWATKNDLRCSDGRIIRRGAFKVQDGHKVPLVWNHKHNAPTDVLGHAILSNRDEGVYMYGYFNDSPEAKSAKMRLQHGDVTALSIWANNLDQVGPEVLHGSIREVSLVLAGANPGAFIESVISHGMSIDESDDEGILYSGESIIIHADEDPEKKEKEGDDVPNEEDEKKETGGKTVGDIYKTLNDEQKKAVAVIVGQAIQDAKSGGKDDEEEDDEEMKHNIFEGSEGSGTAYLSHAEQAAILAEAKKVGSLRETIRMKVENGELVHSDVDTTGMTVATGTQTYGFNDPSMLFPEYKSLNNPPEWISRNMDWVTKVMSGVHRTPFSRIKSVYANITEDEARAKGYIKGKLKKEEVFTTLKRTTDPQTIYKKQKLDRDDVIDITDFDVVAWIRSEMRVMLNEEIARAILIGDGRSSDSDDKIQELHVRPVVTDVPLFNVKVKITTKTGMTDAEVAKETINSIIRSRKKYKGSGSPTFWTTEDVLTEMLLLEDGIGHKLYKTEAELATALRVKDIVTVEPMEGMKVGSDDLVGIIVNLADYNVGADKGGEINNFEDFDIDYNQMKYLIETRISGALIKPYSAITITKGAAASESIES